LRQILQGWPDHGPGRLELSDTFFDLLVEGLASLAEAARYSEILPLTGSEAAKRSYEIVEQRTCCVALARALRVRAEIR